MTPRRSRSSPRLAPISVPFFLDPGARGRTGGQKPKLTPRQARIVQQMYDEPGPYGRRRYTVAQIAAEFGTRPTIYRHLNKLPAETPTS